MRLKIWNSVAFFNYLQVAMGGPREAGTSAQYRQAGDALFEVMDNGDIYILFKGKYRRLQTLLDDTFTVGDDSVFTIISDSK